jgi:hypothetical protein
METLMSSENEEYMEAISRDSAKSITGYAKLSTTAKV